MKVTPWYVKETADLEQQSPAQGDALDGGPLLDDQRLDEAGAFFPCGSVR